MRRLSPRLAIALAVSAAGCALDSSGARGTGGEGGTGGAASSGSSSTCAPGDTATCYSGPADTLRGACRSGTRACDGGTWGQCQDEVLPRDEDCTTPDDEDCDGQAPPCQTWARVLPDEGAGTVRAAVLDPRGTPVLAGWVQGAFDYGGGPQTASGVDASLVRLEAGGGLATAQTFGDAKAQLGQSLALGADGALLFAGRFRGTIFADANQLASPGQSNLFVARFGGGDGPAWTRPIGSGLDDDGIAVALDSEGRTVVAANVAGPALVWLTPVEHAGSIDVLLASLDPAGNVLWAKGYGDAENQTVNGVAVALDDDVVLVGSMRGTMDTGSGPMSAVGGSDAFVARVRSNGSAYWSHSYGGTGDEVASAVAVAPGGGLCVAGSFSSVSDFGAGSVAPAGQRDAFVLKLAASGKLLWARRIGGESVDLGTAVAAGADGGCVVGGSFQGTALAESTELVSSGGSDGFLVRYDVTGALVFARSIGGRGDQTVSTLSADSAGGLLVGGRASISVDLGDGAAPVSIAGDSDPFLVRLAPPG